MHRPVKGFTGIYKRHVLAHHQFFTDVEPRFDLIIAWRPCRMHPASKPERNG